MKQVFICLFVLLLSCNESIDTILPRCIQDIVENESEFGNLETIKHHIVNDESYFWLNTDDRHWDGFEYIVSAQCDTLCYYCGECAAPICIDESSNWETIWEK